MSTLWPEMATLLEKNVFTQVDAFDLKSAAHALDDYEYQVRKNAKAQGVSHVRMVNELHIDFLKVLQQIKKLDMENFPRDSALRLVPMTKKLAKAVLHCRTDGTMKDSVHLETNLLTLLRTAVVLAPKNLDILVDLSFFVRSFIRRHFQSDTVTPESLAKIANFTDHIFSVTYNKGLGLLKSSPADPSWATLTVLALQIMVYGRKTLDDISDRLNIRHTSFRNGPLSSSTPSLGDDFFDSTVDELLQVADSLVGGVNDEIDQFVRSLNLVAFSITLQHIIERLSSPPPASNFVSFERSLTIIADIAAIFDEEPILRSAVALARWATGDRKSSRLCPQEQARESADPLLLEIQLYAFRCVTVVLSESESSAIDNSAVLEAAFRSCCIPFCASSGRMARASTSALEFSFKCLLMVSKNEGDLKNKLKEARLWQASHEAKDQLTPMLHWDNLGVNCQKRANFEYTSNEFQEALFWYRMAEEFYLTNAFFSSATKKQLETRIWPTREFHARSLFNIGDNAGCFESLCHGLLLVTDTEIFDKAFAKAVSFGSRMSPCTSLCERFFAAAQSTPLLRPRFELLVRELTVLREVTTEDTTQAQINALRAMEAEEKLEDSDKTWIAIEMIKLESWRGEKTEAALSRHLFDLAAVVASVKKEKRPNAEQTFTLAKAYLMTHVITTTRLAETIAAKQKAQEEANASPNRLPSADNPEGDDESHAADTDSCTNFVTVSMQSRTLENLEMSLNLLRSGAFHKRSDSLRFPFDLVQVCYLMAAYWELASCPDQALESLSLGLEFAKARMLRSEIVFLVSKISLMLCRQRHYEAAGRALAWIDADCALAAERDSSPHLKLARAIHAFRIKDHDVSDAIVKEMMANAKGMDRQVLVELCCLRGAQLILPPSMAPYAASAEPWESSLAILQFASRLSESLAKTVVKQARGNRDFNVVETTFAIISVYIFFCKMCDETEWIRESGFLYKEAFQVAERFGLPHWMAKIMLARASRDILMDAKLMAESRLKEVAFVLNSPGDAFLAHLKLAGVVGNKSPLIESLLEDDEDDASYILPKVDQVRLKSEGSPSASFKSSSPFLKRTASCVPSFVSHDDGCVCSHCADSPYQQCLVEMMLQHSSLLLKQDAPLQACHAADAAVKVIKKCTDTWKRKGEAWAKFLPGREMCRNSPTHPAEPFFDDLLRAHNLKAEGLMLLGRIGEGQSLLKRVVDEGDHSNWPVVVSPATLGTSHYLYLFSLGKSLSVNERMISPSWNLLVSPAKKSTENLGAQFQILLRGSDDPSSKQSLSTSANKSKFNAENCPPKRVKKASAGEMTNLNKPKNVSPPELKSASNQPAFFVFEDCSESKAKAGVEDDKTEVKLELPKAPKKRVTKSRTAKVSLVEPSTPRARKSSVQTPKDQKIKVKLPSTYTKCSEGNSKSGRLISPPLQSFSAIRKARATPHAKPLSPSESKPKGSEARQNVPTIVLEVTSSPEDNGSLRRMPASLSGDGSSNTIVRGRKKTFKVSPKRFVMPSSSESSVEEDDIFTKKTSPRRKLEETGEDDSGDVSQTKRRRGRPKKNGDDDLAIEKVEDGMQKIKLTSSPTMRFASQKRALTSNCGSADDRPKTRTSTRTKRGVDASSGETVRAGEDDDQLVNVSVLMNHEDEIIDNVFPSPSLLLEPLVKSERGVETKIKSHHVMDAEVMRRDSPNGKVRPKLKLFDGDRDDLENNAGDAYVGGVETFALGRAIQLAQKAVDLMAASPGGFVARKCFERLAMLKGPDDSVSCFSMALQSTGLAFRHMCLLNSSKFVIRTNFGYMKEAPSLCKPTTSMMKFNQTSQQIFSRISESLPSSWKLVQLQVVDSSPILPSVSAKPSSTSLLLVSLYSLETFLCSLTFPFNPRLLSSYQRQLEANLDSVKKGHDDLVSYWAKRESEDRNMAVFLANAERDLLGPWIGLLLGNVVAQNGEELDWPGLTARALQLLPTVSEELGETLPPILMQALLKSYQTLTPALRVEAVQQLIGAQLSIIESQEILRKLENMLEEAVCPQGTKLKKILTQFSPVVLVLDGHLQVMPVERFPSLALNSSTTRLPSALFLPVLLDQAALYREGGVDGNKGWYLIDPASNLAGSRVRMNIWVEKSFPQWDGVVGVEPATEVALREIRTKDIYMYCGHGSGAVFLGKEDVQREVIRAVCLLIGCSSGLLASLGGNLEPWGRVIPFIIGCSPATVTALWEITDRDIDIFTQDMLDYWLKETTPGEKIPLSKVLDKACEKLKCKHANGRAVITYGIPVFRKK